MEIFISIGVSCCTATMNGIGGKPHKMISINFDMVTIKALAMCQPTSCSKKKAALKVKMYGLYEQPEAIIPLQNTDYIRLAYEDVETRTLTFTIRNGMFLLEKRLLSDPVFETEFAWYPTHDERGMYRWVTINGFRLVADDTLMFSYHTKENPSRYSRTAYITLRFGMLRYVYRITQEGNANAPAATNLY